MWVLTAATDSIMHAAFHFTFACNIEQFLSCTNFNYWFINELSYDFIVLNFATSADHME